MLMKQLVAAASLLLGLGLPAAAQTRRVVYGLQLWPELQAELALPGNDYVLVTVRGQQNIDNNAAGGTNRVLGFDERRVTAGYEHFWTEHWSGGATLAYVAAYKAYALVPEVLLRHRGRIGPLTFGQRLSLERTYPSAAGASALTNARLRVDLEKVFAVGRVGLRPRLSYEAMSHVRLLRASTDPDERTIQFTSLRGEVGCRLAPQLDLTPWVAYQSNYYFSLEQSGPMGLIPAGRLNVVYPVVGLEMRYTLLQGQAAGTRQQLPTQH